MNNDVFDHKIICKHCNKEMEKGKVIKNGFALRALKCPKCDGKLIHPVDEERYNKYKNLRSKQYFVKMRLVGNSYAVSIPKEIVACMKQQEKIFDDIVKLCFEDFGRLSLKFGEELKKEKEMENE